MKKFLLLLFLLQCYQGYSQNYTTLVVIDNVDEFDQEILIELYFSDEYNDTYYEYTDTTNEIISIYSTIIQIPNSMTTTDNSIIEFQGSVGIDIGYDNSCNEYLNFEITKADFLANGYAFESCDRNLNFVFHAIQISTPTLGTTLFACEDYTFGNGFTSTNNVRSSWQWSTTGTEGSWNDFTDTSPYQPNLSLPEIIGSDYTGLLHVRMIYNGIVLAKNEYDVVACSIEYESLDTEDVSCYKDNNDGSVTFNFENNIDNTMRFYFFEGTPPSDPPDDSELESENPNVSGEQAVFDANESLTENTADGSFYYTANGLAGGNNATDLYQDYFVVYQELNADGSVKSANISETFRINRPPAVVVSQTQTSVATCIGENAVYALSASGGTGTSYTYQYRIGAGGFNNTGTTFSIPVTANEQTITIKALDANGCESDEVQFTIPAGEEAPSIDASQSSGATPSAPGFTDGTIRINLANTGEGTYDFNLLQFDTATNSYVSFNTYNNVSFSATDLKQIEFTTVPEGQYQVEVTIAGANSCAALSDIYTLTANELPSIDTTTSSKPTCIGADNGSASVTVSGGVNPSFRWEDDTNTVITGQTTTTLTNLAPGTYTFKAISEGGSFDTNGAFSSVAIVIEEADPIVLIDVIPTPVACDGTLGSLTINASGATAYDYSLDSGTSWTALSGNTIDNLAVGFYEVMIRKQKADTSESNCSSELSGSIEITQEETPELTFSLTDATTNGGADGTITINVTGGVPNYTYQWLKDNANYTLNANSTATNLVDVTAGDYQVTVTDVNGCGVTSEIITVSEPGPLAINSLTPTHVLCKGESTGSITADVNGLPEFTYTWSKDGDPSFSAPNQATITDLAIGTYSLSLTDASGDPAVTSTTTITEPANVLSATATTTVVSCFGGNDGSLTITASGGVAPYQYGLNGDVTNLQNNSTFNTLQAAIYSAIVMDANGCEFTINDISLTQADQLIITTDLINNVSESGQSDGAIYTSTTNGTPPYTYAWTGPNGYTETSKDITGLAEGFYALTVTDSNNCSVGENFNITEPGELIATATQTSDLLCYGDNFAEIQVAVQGGVPNYTYQWYQIIEGNNNLLPETSNVISNLAVGAYFVAVTDANGVVENSNTINVTQPDELIATLDTKTDVLCSGEETGSIAITVIGGTTPYQFYWNGEESTSQDLSNLPAGDYFFQVIDANGCFYDELQVTIQAPENPITIENLLVTNASEYQATDGSISLEVVGGAPNYTIVWTRESDNTVVGNSIAIENLEADTYQINIIDTNGCTLTESYELTQPDIIEETITNPTCTDGTDGSISLIVNKGNGTFTYSWDNGATTPAIDNLSAGEYTVIITGFEAPISRTYTVENPLPIIADLGEDRVLCNEQVFEMDATVENPTATYLWTSDNGFSSTEPNVVLTSSGNYNLTVSTTSGCIESDSIAIEVSDQDISAEIAVSSQVYVNENLYLIDISYPLPETMEWIIPDNATIITADNDEALISFDTPGTYEVGIITQLGPCTEIQTKSILVLSSDPTVTAQDTEGGQKLVEEFLVYPNPTSGVFNADISLTEIGNVSVKVFSLNNNMLIASQSERGLNNYKIPFDISNMPTGVYAVILETPFGNTIRKLIIQ